MGDRVLQRIGALRVILFGVGGVGSWCAESLVRSGVRRLTLVDSDRVSITNVNRQMPATVPTVGRVKVEVVRERCSASIPDAEICAVQDIYCAENCRDLRARHLRRDHRRHRFARREGTSHLACHADPGLCSSRRWERH